MKRKVRLIFNILAAHEVSSNRIFVPLWSLLTPKKKQKEMWCGEKRHYPVERKMPSFLSLITAKSSSIPPVLFACLGDRDGVHSFLSLAFKRTPPFGSKKNGVRLGFRI